MFSYSFLFIACLIVAIVVIRFLRSVTDASRSIYNTNLPEKLFSNTLEDNTQNGVVGNTPESLSAINASPALGQASVEWPEPVYRVREQRTQKPGDHKTRHCSLYEADSDGPESAPRPKADWSFQEDNPEPEKKTRPAGGNIPHTTTGKPWGW